MNKSRLAELNEKALSGASTPSDAVEIMAEVYIWLSKFKSEYLAERFKKEDARAIALDVRLTRIEDFVNSPIYSAVMEEEAEEDLIAENKIKIEIIVPKDKAEWLHEKLEALFDEMQHPAAPDA